MTEYCWDTLSKTRYRVKSHDKSTGRIHVESLRGSIGIRLKEEDFNKRYKFITPKDYGSAMKGSAGPKLKCECGAAAAYGDVPASWHSAAMPCPLYKEID